MTFIGIPVWAYIAIGVACYPLFVWFLYRARMQAVDMPWGVSDSIFCTALAGLCSAIWFIFAPLASMIGITHLITTRLGAKT